MPDKNLFKKNCKTFDTRILHVVYLQRHSKDIGLLPKLK